MLMLMLMLLLKTFNFLSHILLGYKELPMSFAMKKNLNQKNQIIREEKKEKKRFYYRFDEKFIANQTEKITTQSNSESNRNVNNCK